jgi:hypothetical protein
MINDSTIFVSVASYRDPETRSTVEDLLSKAKYPKRVYVGVLAQIDRRKESNFLAPFGPNIRQEVLDYKDSKGVCWARSRILTKLRHNEEYVLQIDSHSRFKQDWDVTLLSLYSQLDNRSVISYYPPSYKPNEPINYTENPYIYFNIQKFSDPGIPRFSSGVKYDQKKSIKDCRTIAIAGGCLFGHSSVFNDVPYDPYLYFFGEEPSYALRLFTHGIKCYNTPISFMYHFYNVIDKGLPKNRALHWEDHSKAYVEMNKLAHQRLSYLFKLPKPYTKESLKEIEQYDLGNLATIKQYEDYVGIRFKDQYISDKAKSGLLYK